MVMAQKKSATESKLKRAVIQVLDGKGNKKGDDIDVLFNPTEYSLEKSNEFSNINIPGLGSPLLQFVRGGLETLSMDLFFDTYEKEDKNVKNATDKITNLLKIDEDLHAPPILKFIWGKLNFTAVLTRVTRKFTMFLHDGTPVRATLTVSFSEYTTKFKQKQTVTSSSDRTKHYVLKQGDSLWLLADKEYGNPGLWRPIAEANHIIKPQKLEPGTEIVIPPLE
jgi:hypothetical protein